MSVVPVSSSYLFKEYSNAAAPKPAEEKLHSYIVYDPQKELTSHSRWATVWKTILVISFVVIVPLMMLPIALTAGNTALTAATATFAFLGGLYLFVKIGNYTNGKEAACKEQVSLAIKILKETKKLEGKDTAALLTELGIDPSKIACDKIQKNLSLLRPLIARYYALEGERKELVQKGEEIKQGLQTLDLTTVKDWEFFGINEMKRSELAHLRENSALLKIEMGFILKVLQYPLESQAGIEEYCKIFSMRNCPNLILPRMYEQPHGAILLQTKTEPAQTYTTEEILTAEPSVLAKKIFSF